MYGGLHHEDPRRPHSSSRTPSITPLTSGMWAITLFAKTTSARIPSPTQAPRRGRRRRTDRALRDAALAQRAFAILRGGLDSPARECPGCLEVLQQVAIIARDLRPPGCRGPRCRLHERQPARSPRRAGASSRRWRRIVRVISGTAGSGRNRLQDLDPASMPCRSANSSGKVRLGFSESRTSTETRAFASGVIPRSSTGSSGDAPHETAA